MGSADSSLAPVTKVVAGYHNGTLFILAEGENEDSCYVVDIEPATATVVIGRKEDLMVSGCVIGDATFVAGRPFSEMRVYTIFSLISSSRATALVDKNSFIFPFLGFVIIEIILYF